MRSIHFEGLSAGQGASMALPVYGYYMNSLYRDPTLHYNQSSLFEVPPGFNVDMDCSKVMKVEKEDESAEQNFF